MKFLSFVSFLALLFGVVSGDELTHFTGDIGSELFILSTNFLLYVAVIIIITLVSKYYFPDIWEDNQTIVIIEEHNAEIHEDEDHEDEHNQDLPDNPLASSGNIQSQGGSTRRLLHSSSIIDSTGWNISRTASSKKEVYNQLFTCGFGLITSFAIWGILQERILTQSYNGEYFTYSYGLVFLNRIGGLIISSVLMIHVRPTSAPRLGPLFYEFSFASVSNMLSSWCQYEALKYVAFPTQTLSKCFKMLPIMLMGRLLFNKKFPMYDYIVALAIGCGIGLFVVSTENIQLQTDNWGNIESWGGTSCGLMLLLLFVAFDSFTGQWQTRMFHKYPDLTPIQLMFVINIFSVVLSGITLIHTNELKPAIRFVYNHPEMHFHLMMFSFCSTIGQIFIFHTIKSFGAVVFSILMTTRILISIFLSCIFYDHTIDVHGYAGLAIVFIAIGYRIRRKIEGKHLIIYEGIQDSEGPQMLKEWHEHLDL